MSFRSDRSPGLLLTSGGSQPFNLSTMTVPDASCPREESNLYLHVNFGNHSRVVLFAISYGGDVSRPESNRNRKERLPRRLFPVENYLASQSAGYPPARDTCARSPYSRRVVAGNRTRRLCLGSYLAQRIQPLTTTKAIQPLRSTSDESNTHPVTGGSDACW